MLEAVVFKFFPIDADVRVKNLAVFPLILESSLLRNDFIVVIRATCEIGLVLLHKSH